MARWILIGNPENRRVGMFQAALASSGEPAAAVVSWRELIADPGCLAALPDGDALVRIDSCGEDFAVEKALLHRGFSAASGGETLSPKEIDALEEDLGRILAPRQQHRGFLSVIDDVARVVAERPRWRMLNPIPSIIALFDKRETSRLYGALGVPIPRALPPARTTDELLESMRAAGVDEAYVKMSSSSSASCLAIVTSAGTVITTVEEAGGGRRYNTRALQRIRTPRRVRSVVDFILGEGAQIEESVEKARLGERWFDTRVVAVAGEPAFTVVRTSPHPITNLHLGGQRGTIAELESLVPASVREDAAASCRTIAKAHGALHVGIDLMYTAELDGHRVLEANAFGDLLPNLTRDGLSVHEWEIRAALSIGR
jgi:hypothetical protein